jgi:FkbM family methyltransferase
MRCFEDDLLTTQLRIFGAHTRPELAFLSSVVEPGDRVFDLGAHVGTFAIPLARCAAPTGTVIAVEAYREYFDLLVDNVRANGLAARVIPIHALLGRVGSTYTVTHETPNSMATSFVSAPSQENAIHARVWSVDKIVTDHGPPDVVKIDIEGLEVDVLETSDALRNAQPVVYAEVSAVQLGRYGRTVRDLNDLLLDLDYRLFRNVGPRNAAHDQFQVAELRDLFIEAPLFDVLAIPSSSPRLRHLASIRQ